MCDIESSKVDAGTMCGVGASDTGKDADMVLNTAIRLLKTNGVSEIGAKE
jgi:hypothetical protein